MKCQLDTLHSAVDARDDVDGDLMEVRHQVHGRLGHPRELPRSQVPQGKRELPRIALRQPVEASRRLRTERVVVRRSSTVAMSMVSFVPPEPEQAT